MSREIEFWFEFGSNYSYLSVMRIEDAAARQGATIAWKPFLLGPIFKSFGWESSPFIAQKEKGEYVMKDMVRQCRKYGLPWTRPTNFPRIAVLPMRVALVGAGESWIAEYCRRMMLLNFSQDREINTEDAVGDVLASLGLPAPDLLRKAQTEQNKLRLREQTETARARGIFGAPTFFVRGEMFWGNDRLDDALAFAAQAG
jgi:2-hydroxychromene-2-carboxylate isomerase